MGFFFSIILLFAIGVGQPLWVYASPVDSKADGPNLFCVDAYSSLCESSNSNTSNFNAQNLRKFASKILERESLKKYQSSPYSNCSTVGYGKKSDGCSEFLFEFEQNILKELLFKRAELNKFFLELKSVLKNIVENSTQLDSKSKTDSLQKLAELQILTYADYVDKFGWNGICSDSKRQPVLVNALYLIASNVVVVCPALLLTVRGATNALSSASNSLDGLRFMISHEIGHGISVASGPKVYSKLLACYKDVQGLDMGVDFKSLWSQSSRDQELIADYWGGFALANHVIKSAKEDALAVLQRNAAPFCTATNWEDLPQGSAHLPDKARAALVIGQNPILRKYFKCTPPNKQKPLCDIGGEVTSQ